MPRVGSSNRSTLGLEASHLPRITFCWFPPESFSTRASSPGFDTHGIHLLGAGLFDSGPVDKTFGNQFFQDGQDQVLLDRGTHDQPVLFAVLADQGHALGDASWGEAKISRLCPLTSRKPDTRLRAAPKSALNKGGSPRSHEPADAQNLPLFDLERNTLNHVTAGVGRVFHT